ncbi:hypothetical protein ACJDU8_21210 [Clostridium sp. WILCCON 0269]|uniref:Uncharacterized protein n=1 Tax=Candidatus Clostridium eludens TaxID=3381663 RepID=A0ABW8SQQ5_9CLOT
MDFSAVAKEAFTIILPSLIAIKDGGLKSIGSDIWELVKKPFKSNKRDEEIISKLEKNPNDLESLGIAKYKLTEFLEKDPDLAEELIKYIENFKKENQNGKTINVKNSKNFIINTDIHNGGDVVVGDGNFHVR